MAVTDGRGDLIYSSRDLKRKFPEQGFYNHIKIDTDGIVLGNSCRPFLSIDGYAINDGSIPDSKIIDVDFAKIKNVLIDTAQIKDAAITTAKIANLAVTTAKIANLAVTNAKINDLSASKINAGYIVTTQLDAGSNPSTGCILDGNGLRAYKSGTKVVDVSENPYFRGEGHFGDDNDYTLLGDPTYGGRIYFYQSGYQRGLIYGDGDGLHLQTYNELRLDEDTRLNGKLYTGALEPTSTTVFNIGSSSKEYQTGWIYTVRSYRVNPRNSLTGSVGQSTLAWNDIYYCNDNCVCSLGMVEEIANPLELIKNIKVSKDKYTPKEIPKADYKTLPKFIKTVKYDDLRKKEKNFKERLQNILSKNAETTYEDNEKVTVKVEALDTVATMSLLLGAIRQLNKKVEALENIKEMAKNEYNNIKGGMEDGQKIS